MPGSATIVWGFAGRRLSLGGGLAGSVSLVCSSSGPVSCLALHCPWLRWGKRLRPLDVSLLRGIVRSLAGWWWGCSSLLRAHSLPIWVPVSVYPCSESVEDRLSLLLVSVGSLSSRVIASSSECSDIPASHTLG
ncbi:hypothetical protein Rs2_36275 [Raphanus sativus]|nr:hypothetical protein Rs2_36275 [Raphanus sativus]